MVHIGELLRMLKIGMDCSGTALIYDLYYGKRQVDELSEKEIQDIRYAWNSRNYIPEDIWNGQYSNKIVYIKPIHRADESEEDYSRRYVANMIEYLRDSEDPKWHNSNNPSLRWGGLLYLFSKLYKKGCWKIWK